MITEWFFSLWVGVVEWFSSLLPQDDPPDFLSTVAGFIEDLVASSAGLGAWVPWAFLGLVGGTILTLWLVLVLVKGVRWVWGLTPFSGGS